MEHTTLTKLSYFEDFTVGQELKTTHCAVTEAHVDAFATLSGDYNKLHIDADFAKRGPYGRRIAHGLLTVSLVSGLVAQLGILDESVLAFRELDWKFRKPVYIGDVICAEVSVTEMTAISRLHAGLMILTIQVYNQHRERVQTGTWRILLRSRQQS